MKWAIRFMSLHPGSKSHAVHLLAPYRTRRLPVMAHGEGARWWRAAAGCARTFALVRPPRYFGEWSASQLHERRPMRSRLLATMFVVLASAATADAQNAPKKPPAIINPPPTAQDYADLAKLPDWSGVWNPKITDQDAQARTNPPPWNEKVAKEVEKMWADEKAGRPKLIFYGCFPEAHPSWMLVTHNAMEILFNPGRVTMLGESDGNRLRRIYTDGRPHPDTSDPTFHGHSIGHWEGDTLVVDTVDILPQAPLAVSEAAGLPNNGDMHTIERIHLADKDVLHVDLEIIAPKILTKPWKTTRIFFRQRARKFDIVEGVCQLGDYREAKDENGHHVFVPVEKTEWGNLVAPK